MYDHARIYDVIRFVKRDKGNRDLQLGFMMERDFPRKLYRYTKCSHAEDLAKRGTVRLGNLFSYAKAEGLTLAQFDHAEGIVTYNTSDEHGRTPVQITPVALDQWVLCFSEKLDKDLLSDFDADTIVEIEAAPFCRVLARRMVPKSNVGWLRKVQYLSVDDLAFDQYNLGRVMLACMVKQECYSAQSEWRIVFEDRTSNSNPPPNSIPKMREGKDWITSDSGYPGFGVSRLSGEVLMPPNPVEPIFVNCKELSRFARIIHTQ
jgi:hypothetical protein